MKFFSIVIFCLICLFSLCQTYEIIHIKGIVFNENNKPLSFVLIYDSLQNKGYISNDIGAFDFFTINNNLLLFKHLGYKIQKIKISTDKKIVYLKIYMEPDTIVLKQINVVPWKNYEQFVYEFLNVNLPEDDYYRAQKNFEILKSQLLTFEDEFPLSSIAYRNSVNQLAEKLYWKGQNQPIQIFNLIAWKKFIEFLRKEAYYLKDFFQ